MGNCGSSGPPADNSKKFLLAGISAVGKTTILNNLKIDQGNVFTDEYRLAVGAGLEKQLLDEVKRVFVAVLSKVEKEKSKKKLVDINQVTSSVDTDAASHERKKLCWEKIEACFSLKEIEKAFFKEAKDIIPQTMVFFFEKEKFKALINTLAKDGEIVASNDDILHYRETTRKANEFNFNLNGKSVTLIDVGGQMTQRQSWIEQFNPGLLGILFVVACDDYRTKSSQAETRMMDSLRCFTDILSEQSLTETPIILLMNKFDIFSQLITKNKKKDRLEKYFKGYSGKGSGKKGNPEAALEFLVKQFDDRWKNAGRREDITHFATNATDIELMSKLWDSILKALLAKSMSQNSLL